MNWTRALAYLLFGLCLITNAFSWQQNLKDYPFGENQITFAFENLDWVNWDPPTPPSPIFWNIRHVSANIPGNHGDYARQGGMLRYSRMFLARRYFSMSLGSSVSYWQNYRGNLWAYSVYLQMRLWLPLGKNARAYLLYSIAGPTYLTNRRFGSAYFSENFLFQDYLGVGLQLGNRHAIDIEAYTTHYSNGDIFAVNSGIQVPIMFALGYSF